MIKKIPLFLLSCLLTAVVACSPQSSAPVEADNTARNAESPAALTPLDQSESPADLEVSANIRKAIVADDSLSLDAHNIKIITSGGTVTLRGPVKSQEEKAAIEAKAKQIAGVTQIESLLEVE